MRRTCYWFFSRVVAIALLASHLSSAIAAEYTGKVVSITDGDTIRVLYQSGQLKVRLAEIDTPEKGQPYGSRARQELADLCFQKEVRVVEQTRDRYGRVVGRVYCDGVDANAEMVRRGAAWVYRLYARDKSLYGLEQEARAAKRGLWSLPRTQRVAPWEWRHANKGAEEEPKSEFQAKQPVAGFQCGTKRYCKEMESCAEARFYLEQCGLTRLDGDGDRIPCEALCK